MSSANLQGFSNLIVGSGQGELKNPKWLNKSDIIETSQSALPTIDESKHDLASQSGAITAQSRRIVNQARGKSNLTTKVKKSTRTRKSKNPIKRKLKKTKKPKKGKKRR